MAQINPNTLHFLSQLALNNNKPWFDIHKPDYEIARENMLQFVTELLTGIKAIEPILEKDPKKHLSRIYRDIRFSKDKTPYKNFFGCEVERAANYSKCPFYVHISPGECFIGAGLWQPEPDTLKKIRQELDYNGVNFQAILDEPKFKNHYSLFYFDKLSRPPKGISPDHPYIELLKLKQLLIQRRFTDEEVTHPNFRQTVLESYEVASGFFGFVDSILE